MVCSVMGVRFNTGFRPLLLLFALLSFHVDHALDTNFYLASKCRGTNYTTEGKFEANMGRVFSTMTNDAPSVGFSHAIAGEGSERVYGLVQCRGDIGLDQCRVCISNATKYIVGDCPYSMDASVWYEKCQLRYSNTNFFGLLNFVDYGSWIWVPGQVTDSVFHEKLGSLLKNLSSLATTEPSRLMFAMGDNPYTDLQTIYGLVHCTRDISLADCKQCLNHTILQLPSICGDAQGGEIATGSCRVRYGTQLFYEAPATRTPSGQQESKTTKIMFIIIVISAVIVVLNTCFVCGFYWWKREFCCHWRKTLNPGRLQRKKEEDDGSERALRRADAIDGATLDLAIVRAATNDFTPENKLGQGGFGAVYRGQLLDGQEIAVKRLSRNTGHGPKQFDNEVRTLAKLQHRNLVRLLGGVMEGEEKILVYEYVRNTSLDNFLFGEPTKRMQLDWPVRFKLINGIARGLLYLHEDSRLRIVHRDLKASNILLDEDMNPKISDFGTAKIFDTDQTQTETLEIMGTRFSSFSAVDIWHLSIFLKEGCQ